MSIKVEIQKALNTFVWRGEQETKAELRLQEKIDEALGVRLGNKFKYTRQDVLGWLVEENSKLANPKAKQTLENMVSQGMTNNKRQSNAGRKKQKKTSAMKQLIADAIKLAGDREKAKALLLKAYRSME